MQAKALPSSQGWIWFRKGVLLWLALWQRNAGLAAFITFFSLLALLLVNFIPFFALLLPVCTLIVLNGFRWIDEEHIGSPRVLLFGVKRNLSALFLIGAAYLIATILMTYLAMLVEGGTLSRWMTGVMTSEPVDITYSQALYSMAVTLLFQLPVLLAYWLAPVLTGWWNCPPFKAMFFSFVVSFRNWRAFLTYGIAVTLGMIFLSVTAGVLIIAIPQLSGLLMLIFMSVLIPVWFAGYYVLAKDIFSPPDDTAQEPHYDGQ